MQYLFTVQLNFCDLLTTSYFWFPPTPFCISQFGHFLFSQFPVWKTNPISQRSWGWIFLWNWKKKQDEKSVDERWNRWSRQDGIFLLEMSDAFDSYLLIWNLFCCFCYFYLNIYFLYHTVCETVGYHKKLINDSLNLNDNMIVTHVKKMIISNTAASLVLPVSFFRPAVQYPVQSFDNFSSSILFPILQLSASILESLTDKVVKATSVNKEATCISCLWMNNSWPYLLSAEVKECKNWLCVESQGCVTMKVTAFVFNIVMSSKITDTLTWTYNLHVIYLHHHWPQEEKPTQAQAVKKS